LPSASEAIAERLAAGAPVRIEGAGTKAGWGRPLTGLEPLSTTEMDRIAAHDAGDFTAVLEAGVPLAVAQEAFAAAGQMLALDPPGAQATIGGVVASADSGPLRHRYGAPRDLVIGITLALPDGTVARSGGRVIKNVAGYDLPKLAAGSYGTLGVITEVCVRLHPLPARTATAVIRHDDPRRLQTAALELAALPLEAEALDVRWAGGEGAILARFGGAAALERAHAVSSDVEADDDPLWQAQRDGQRGELVVRVAGLPTDLARVIATARSHDATVVGRAGVGTYWLRLPADADADADTDAEVAAIRAALRPRPAVLTDAPPAVRAAVDPWDVPEGPELELMRRVKERFDPTGACNPGLFAGGI
jgi:glycolate oxidase FAD binding subunit